MPKKRKTERQKLTKKLDAVFSRWVRQRGQLLPGAADEVECYTCNYVGPAAKLQNGHYWVRQHKSVRWDEDNCRPQCRVCNMFYGGRTQLFGRRLEAEGVDMEALERRKNTPRTYTLDELRELIEHYSQLVGELEP